MAESKEADREGATASVSGEGAMQWIGIQEASARAALSERQEEQGSERDTGTEGDSGNERGRVYAGCSAGDLHSCLQCRGNESKKHQR